MTSVFIQAAGGLGAAWAAGGLIGWERSFHGRAAGFRTHALVGIASSATVLVALAPGVAPDAVGVDASRLAQGVMTGIGFLGAGVIFKEGVNVQGLTTAASVWATAAIGLLFGVGEYFAGLLATAAVLATLLVLRWVEPYLPVHVYAWCVFRFRTAEAPDMAGLRILLAADGVSMRDISYARCRDGALVEFSGNVMTMKDQSLDNLASSLRAVDSLVEFEITRISK